METINQPDFETVQEWVNQICNALADIAAELKKINLREERK